MYLKSNNLIVCYFSEETKNYFISITSVWHLYFVQHLRKVTINALFFCCSALSEPLSWCVVCVGPQPAACEDRGPAVIETCYRSTAAHKDGSIQTVRGYTSVCRSDGELLSAIHTLQARKTSRSKCCTKNTHVLLLWRTTWNLQRRQMVELSLLWRDVFIWKMFRVEHCQEYIWKLNC